ncbi:MAG: NAD(P)/FAD-dependent oxidoreductase, partial [Pseudonocardiaceae bacterium]
MTDEVEVCVIGGGPAGAALATRLAGLGHQVVVVEQHRFPRPHIGESLSPAIWPLLESLGVRDRVAARGFTQAVRARVRWRGADEERVAVGDGLTVDRGAFDAILLHRAREAGAEVLSPATARRPARSGAGWAVPLGGRVLQARFLA